MQCPECGGRIERHQNFCGHCGSHLPNVDGGGGNPIFGGLLYFVRYLFKESPWPMRFVFNLFLAWVIAMVLVEIWLLPDMCVSTLSVLIPIGLFHLKGL